MGDVGTRTVTKGVEEGWTMFNGAPIVSIDSIAFDLADCMILKGGGVGGNRGRLSRRCLTSREGEGGGEVEEWEDSD